MSAPARSSGRALSAALARLVPLITVTAALLLSGRSVLAFVHGTASGLTALENVTLAVAVSFAACRFVLAVVERYERQAARNANTRNFE